MVLEKTALGSHNDLTFCNYFPTQKSYFCIICELTLPQFCTAFSTKDGRLDNVKSIRYSTI